MAIEVKVGDYLKDILSRYSLTLSDNEFGVLMLKQKLDPDALVTESFNPDLVLYYLIPDLLLMPDRTQGDTSKKWDRSAILDFYAILSDRLGLPNVLVAKPTIKARNDIW